MRLAVAVLVVGLLGSAPANGAVSQVHELHACVRTDGTVRLIRAYAPVCRGSEQPVSWRVDP
jgi:hypothetical protein